MGNPASELERAGVIACKTLHTLRHCQLPKGSEISNFGNKDEDSEQSWATIGEQPEEGGGKGDDEGGLTLCKIGPGGQRGLRSSPEADSPKLWRSTITTKT